MAEHHLEVTDDDRWAARSADVFEMAIRTTVEARGRCVLALSGGTTPAPAFRALAERDLPWRDVVVTQVDERLAALGSDRRNLTQQLEAFGDRPIRWLPLPVEDPTTEGLAGYLVELRRLAGPQLILDVVHLGLGGDGHTASLVPGDPVLEILDADVARTGSYQGSDRLTLTRPILDRARLVLWLVRGRDKSGPLARLLAGDGAIPAGRLEPRESVIVADRAAASPAS